MKSNYTHSFILLDRSGSMQSIKSDIIGGFNKFLEDQSKVDGKFTITLAQFDDKYETLYDMVDIKEIAPLTDATFQPRNSTALYDSTAKIIIEGGETLAKLSEDERPSKVLVTIITDGEENASKEYSNTRVLELIKNQESKYKWEFVYIGANQDAFKVARTLGIKMSANYRGDSVGTMNMFAAYSDANTQYRSMTQDSFKINDEDIKKKEKK